MAKYGIRSVGGQQFAYSEGTAGESAAVGINTTNGHFHIVVQATANATTAGTPIVDIESALNGNVNLTPNGSGTVVISQAQVTGSTTMSGSQAVNYVSTATSPYVALTSDYYISVDSSGGLILVQLPDAAALGQVFVVKDQTGSAGTNNIGITTVSGTTLIDGATSYNMNTNYESVMVIFNGAAYEIF